MLYERWSIITLNQTCRVALLFFSMIITHMSLTAKSRNVVRHYLDTDLKGTSNAQLKVFFISDIHRRKINHKLLKKIDKDIDIVIIGGDLAEKNVPLSRISKNIQNLSRLGQLFFVWGNNDREVGENEIRKIIAKYNGIILDNENCQIPGQPGWGICGTDDPSSENVNVEATLRNIKQYEKVIFVSHQPCVLKKIECLFEPTIMLAGHTHGGQIRMGKYGIAQKGYFRKSYGRAKLISNGYGTTKIPLRFGAPPECHIITLHFRR